MTTTDPTPTITAALRELIEAARRELATPDPPRDPRVLRALDRTLPVAERRAAWASYADEYAGHWHPGHPRHSHRGGDVPHTHKETTP